MSDLITKNQIIEVAQSIEGLERMIGPYEVPEIGVEGISMEDLKLGLQTIVNYKFIETYFKSLAVFQDAKLPNPGSVFLLPGGLPTIQLKLHSSPDKNLLIIEPFPNKALQTILRAQSVPNLYTPKQTVFYGLSGQTITIQK